MRNYWLVAKHEYRRMAVRRGFVLMTLAIPFGIAVLIGLGILIETQGTSGLPLGYVDQSRLLDPTLKLDLPESWDPLSILDFADKDAAEKALVRGQIQAYFVIPPGYPEDLATDLYYLEEPPGGEIWEQFDEFIRLNLVAGLTPDLKERVLEEPVIIVQDVVSGREFSQSTMVNIVLPFAASFFFMIATMSASGYMLQVVADEKESRTIEIMLTSLSPRQLIIGKALGLLGVAVTQLMIYTLAAVIGLTIAANSIPGWPEITIPWDYLGVMAAFFLPAYVLMTAIMVAIGSAVDEIQQGQQVAGLLNMIFLLPILSLIFIFDNPGSPLVVALSLFPPTAFLTISLRWGLGSVPIWQLITSWLLLVTAGGLMILAAARIFQEGMLRYGQSLSFKSVLTMIRSS